MTRACSFILVMAISHQAFAWLWDYDTLAMEKATFPTALDLITGKFARHSPAFYRWRIKDRAQRLVTQPTPEVFNDVAVAHDKLGEHQRAIELMLEKEKQFPGLYETYANLGTFYIHSGKLERGAKEIERAIEINPDAHFGREVYQLMLVKYVLSRQKNGDVLLPLNTGGRSPIGDGFNRFVVQQSNRPALSDMYIEKAIKGVLGMMREAPGVRRRLGSPIRAGVKLIT